MDAACARLEARAKARAENERAEYERKVAARAGREGSAKGPEPKPPADTPGPDEQINLTDPDARLMRKSKREGYTQSYNAQASSPVHQPPCYGICQAGECGVCFF